MNEPKKELDIRITVYRFDKAEYGRQNEERYEINDCKTIDEAIRYLEGLKKFFEIKVELGTNKKSDGN